MALCGKIELVATGISQPCHQVAVTTNNAQHLRNGNLGTQAASTETLRSDGAEDAVPGMASEAIMRKTTVIHLMLHYTSLESIVIQLPFTFPIILRYLTVPMARSVWNRVKGPLRYVKINPDNSASPY